MPSYLIQQSSPVSNRWVKIMPREIAFRMVTKLSIFGLFCHGIRVTFTTGNAESLITTEYSIFMGGFKTRFFRLYPVGI
jgi:hypothetical protein